MTSPRAKILNDGTKLRLIELIPGVFNGGHLFRFDFITTDDEGKGHVNGGCSVRIKPKDSPLEIAKTLRGAADMIDRWLEKSIVKEKINETFRFRS
jgi:hypothetical protein